ncbi:MAG: hypothetical protein ACSLE6_19480 [Mycobacterium sp.]
MAELKYPQATQTATVEVFEINLDTEEQQELRADPTAFLKSLLGDKHQISGVYVDVAITEDQCPSGSYELVHVLSPNHLRCRHMLRCIDLK